MFNKQLCLQILLSSISWPKPCPCTMLTDSSRESGAGAASYADAGQKIAAMLPGLPLVHLSFNKTCSGPDDHNLQNPPQTLNPTLMNLPGVRKSWTAG